MKNLVVAFLLVFTILGLYSCKKSNQGPKPVVTGRWSLVSDSSIFVIYGFPSGSKMYIGKLTDYYDFEPGGKMSWYEDNIGSDSGAYVLGGDTSMTLMYFPKSNPTYGNSAPGYFKVTSLTEHKMVLTNGPFPSSGYSGYIGEIMTFGR